jgi:hypothetical protein
VKTYLGQPHNAETLKLYRNKHDGTVETVAAEPAVSWLRRARPDPADDCDRAGTVCGHLEESSQTVCGLKLFLWPGLKWAQVFEGMRPSSDFRDEFLAIRADAILGSDEAPSRLLPLPAAAVIRSHLSIISD